MKPEPFLDSRPWGEELWLTRGLAEKPSMVKVISVNPGESLSLQFHEDRAEYWVVVSGNGTAEVGDERLPLSPGAHVFVEKKAHHRVHGGTEKLVFVEMAFGRFDETDITRLEDKYGRIK